MNQTKTVQTTFFPVVEQHILTQALWVTGFALLTAVGAQIEVPHQPVPYTMQTFFVLLSGALLGKRNAAFSQLLYLGLGALGLPVFAQFGFGITRLLGPTGGYLLSFPVAAFAVGYIIDKNKSIWWTALAMFVGSLFIFSLGTLQLQFLYYQEWVQSLLNGFLIFSWWDILKVSAATILAHQLRKIQSGS
ncbi:MAG: biotin transporter BioY [Ignavibacteriae bacterium]|nr:biotin transporter BioY [Ignavibacteriota bacterium]